VTFSIILQGWAGEFTHVLNGVLHLFGLLLSTEFFDSMVGDSLSFIWNISQYSKSIWFGQKV
jgi:hypothetical protein